MLIPGNGRYQSLPTASIKLSDGRTVTYLLRRFLPDPANFATLQTFRVAEGDRLDNLAAQSLGDPEQFWRLCDANGAMNPDDLTATPGRTLRVTLPEGILATPNA